MLNFPPAVRIWLATAPVDLRRSFDGLAEEVRQHLHNDPLSGHVFVFRNKRGDRVKLLYWDEDGFVIVYKRLEVGVFRWPAAVPPASRASPSAPRSWRCCWTASTGRRPSAAGATTGRRRRRERLAGGRAALAARFFRFLRNKYGPQYVIIGMSLADPATGLPPTTAEQLPDDVATLKRMVLELLASCTSVNATTRRCSTGSTCCCAACTGRAANASTPTNRCCSRRWPRARTRPRRPSRRRRRRPSGGAGPMAAAACRTTCPASPGITSCPRPSASARAAASVRIDIGADRSEQLDYRPASLFVIEHFVHKYACPCCSKRPAQSQEQQATAGPGARAHAVAATRTPASVRDGPGAEADHSARTGPPARSPRPGNRRNRSCSRTPARW